LNFVDALGEKITAKCFQKIQKHNIMDIKI
jgi:hypothetical protein